MATIEWNNLKQTNTTLFLFPVFGIPEKDLQAMGFENAYLKDAEREFSSTEHLIYALFRPRDSFLFQQIIERLDERNIIYADYDYAGGHVVVVFIFPPEFNEDYKKVILGKFSKLSPEFIKRLPATTEVGDITKVSLQRHVYNRSKELAELIEESLNIDINDMGPDFEYWKINMEKEILYPDKLPIAIETNT